MDQYSIINNFQINFLNYDNIFNRLQLMSSKEVIENNLFLLNSSIMKNFYLYILDQFKYQTLCIFVIQKIP